MSTLTMSPASEPVIPTSTHLLCAYLCLNNTSFSFASRALPTLTVHFVVLEWGCVRSGIEVIKQQGKCAKEVDTIGTAIDAKMKPVLSIGKGKTSAPFWKCDLSKIEAQLKSCTYSPLPGG